MEPSGRMVADDVAMRAIMADPVLQWYIMMDEVMQRQRRKSPECRSTVPRFYCYVESGMSSYVV
jgi:hypothetical protein